MNNIPARLFLLAFGIRIAAIYLWEFDGLYGQDAFAYLQQAQAMSAALSKGQMPPTDFFWPNGFPALLLVTSLTRSPSALSSQLVVLLCGALMSPMLYWLCKALFPPPHNQLAGIIAALLMAVAGQPILSSIVIMADLPALLWATISVWCLVQATNAYQPRHRSLLFFALAGLTIALAIVTRWIYVLLVPILILFSLYKLISQKQPWWLPSPAVVGGIVVLSPQLWFSLHRPETFFHSWLLGWHITNFFQHQFETVDGLLVYPLPVGIYYAQPAGHPAYIFPLLGIAAFWGIWQLYRAQAWGALILLLGWAGTVYLFLAGIPYQNFRFGLTLVLPLMMLTGFGLSHLWYQVSNQKRKLLKYGSVALFVCSLLGMLAWAYPMSDTFLTRQNHSKVIAAQVEQRLPPQTTVLTFGLTLTLQHYTLLHAIELFHQDQDTVQKLVTDIQPIYLLLDTHNIETQWQGKIPHQHYLWLQHNTRLTIVGTFPPFTLYQINKQSATNP